MLVTALLVRAQQGVMFVDCSKLDASIPQDKLWSIPIMDSYEFFQELFETRETFYINSEIPYVAIVNDMFFPVSCEMVSAKDVAVGTSFTKELDLNVPAFSISNINTDAVINAVISKLEYKPDEVVVNVKEKEPWVPPEPRIKFSATEEVSSKVLSWLTKFSLGMLRESWLEESKTITECVGFKIKTIDLVKNLEKYEVYLTVGGVHVLRVVLSSNYTSEQEVFFVIRPDGIIDEVCFKANIGSTEYLASFPLMYGNSHTFEDFKKNLFVYIKSFCRLMWLDSLCDCDSWHAPFYFSYYSSICYDSCPDDILKCTKFADLVTTIKNVNKDLACKLLRELYAERERAGLYRAWLNKEYDGFVDYTVTNNLFSKFKFDSADDKRAFTTQVVNILSDAMFGRYYTYFNFSDLGLFLSQVFAYQKVKVRSKNTFLEKLPSVIEHLDSVIDETDADNCSIYHSFISDSMLMLPLARDLDYRY